jgi:two-component system response regulator QseB
MRILIVEDDPMIGAGIRTGLRQDGYTADWARDGNSAELAVATNEYDAILLDLGLPGRSGLELLAQWRRKRNTVPIMIITARDSVEDRIAGLDTGADDYLVKPFDLNELAARLRALLRRRSGRATPVIEHGPLHLDPATHEVHLNGTAVKLSGREFALLHALLQVPGVPLSRSQLEDRLYGWEEEIGSNAVEVHIHALRRKIGSELIRNVRGVGYMVPRQA